MADRKMKQNKPEKSRFDFEARKEDTEEKKKKTSEAQSSSPHNFEQHQLWSFAT